MAVPKGRHRTSHELIIRWFSDAMLRHEAKGRRRASHELIVDREKRAKEKGVQRRCSVPFYIWQGDEGEGGPPLLHHVEGGWGGQRQRAAEGAPGPQAMGVAGVRRGGGTRQQGISRQGRRKLTHGPHDTVSGLNPIKPGQKRFKQN
jgi:hypothetical protein